MKPAYGRIVFGLAALLSGVIALRWHDAETWQGLVTLWKLPLGTAIGTGLMAAQAAGGVSLLDRRTARPASVVLAVVYGAFVFACVPAIVATPATYAPYVGFFEQLAPFCGALAAYALTGTRPARAARFGRAARLGLGLCAISFTLAQAIYLKFTASLVPRWIPPSQTFWAVLTTIAFALAAFAILTNIRARLATRLMSLMLLLFGLLVWVPLVAAHPAVHGNWSELALTFLIAGATATVAEVKSP